MGKPLLALDDPPSGPVRQPSLAAVSAQGRRPRLLRIDDLVDVVLREILRVEEVGPGGEGRIEVQETSP